MAIANCVPEIRAIAGDRLSDDQINQIIEELQRRSTERKRLRGAERDDDVLMQEAQQMVEDMDVAAKMAKRNRALNVLARKKIDETIATFEAEGLRPHQALEALLVGINRDVPGGKLSVGAKGDGILREYMGGMISELRKAGVLEHLTRRGGILGDGKGALDREIAREMWAVSAGEGPATGSKEARAIAEILHKHQERARQRLNRAGGWVGKRADYIVRQSHDQVRVTQEGFDSWHDFIVDLLDHEATFGGADPKKFLKGAYDGITSGVHLRADQHGQNPPEGGYFGPANLAKKVSSERTLHFKDADAWVAYNGKFGTKSLLEAYVSGLELSARATALMETFGPNPRSMFERVIDDLREKHRDKPAIMKRLGGPRGQGSELDLMMKTVDGTTRQVANITVAHYSSAFRALQDMAKLGGALITSFADIPLHASDLRWQGVNLGDAYVNAFAAPFDGLSSPESRELSDLLGIGYESMTGDVVGRFGSTDNIPGMMSGLQRKFFQLNLLGPWTDAHKRSIAKMMTRNLAMQAEKGFADLDPRMQRMLRMYGIDETDWDVIRSAKRMMADGREHLVPDAVRDLNDDALAPLIGERLQKIEDDIARRTQAARKAKDAARLQTLPAERARRIKSVRERELDRLVTAMRTLLTDRADTGIPTPGARERVILHRGTMRGTMVGEALRFVMQFKAFPVGFVTKVLGREMGGYGLREALLQGKGDLLGIAHLVAATTIMGMGAMQMKEILKGRSPRDPFGENWRSTWTAAMLQGGGLGIYGDFLFGEYNRFGRSFTATLGGPSLGTADDVMELLARMRAGDDFGGNLLRVIQSNTPFANLFYTRAALDYLVIYQLQEAMNPGYLRRMERRIERENDQTFILRPSEAVQ